MSQFYALVKMTLVTSYPEVITAFKAKWLFQAINIEIPCNLGTENARIMFLKILTHSMAGCVTFCFNVCFVKCFSAHSVLKTYQ